MVECAASDHDGTSLLIQATADQDGSHSLYQNKYSDPQAESLPVTLRRLDDILSGMPRVDLLKVDAEFHDLQVLQGLGDRLGEIELIYVEMSHDQFEPCFELLSRKGYKPHGTSKAKRRDLRRNPKLIHPFDRDSRRRDLLWSRRDLQH